MKDIKKIIVAILLVASVTLICCFIFIKPNKLIRIFESPITNLDLTTNDNKKLLKLNHTVNFNFEPNNILNITTTNIEVGKLPEIKTKSYEGEIYLDPIVNYIKNNFDIDIDHRWDFTIRYNGDDIGMIYFDYTIGEITTNKSINFSFEDGIVKDIYYKCLEYETNEEALVNRFINFTDKYKQEGVKFSAEEKVIEEKTNYTYFYNCDKFLYSYIISTSGFYEGLERHNHHETLYLIDENGNAIE